MRFGKNSTPKKRHFEGRTKGSTWVGSKLEKVGENLALAV